MSTSRLYASKSTEERQAERRARLMAAGLEAFGSNGFDSATVEDLCRLAGTSTRAFYELFTNREELLIALHDDLNDRAFAAVVASISDVDPLDVRARATAGASAYFEVMTADRRWARIALVETVRRSPLAESHRRAAIDRFAALLHVEADRLTEAGIAPRRDWELTAVALTGALTGLVSTWTADGTWDQRLPGVIDEAVRLLVLAITGDV
jgi:AcrR family transcriptional regulator